MKRISVMLILATALLAGCSSVSSTSSESLSVQESVLTSTVEQESATMINEEEKVLAVYKSMQQAMIDKDIDKLDRIVKDGTTFTHMSGKTQTKEEYFGEIADGTVLESWFPLGGRGNTQTLFNDSTISAIAKAHGKSSAQVIIRWHLQAGNICIPGSSNEQHIIEDYDVWNFELTDEEMAQMTALEKDERFADY